METENKIASILGTTLGIVFFCSFFISIPSLAGTKPPPAVNEEETITLSYDDHDPDGDNDTKGANYFPLKRVATGKRVFIFDPNFKAWAVYNKKGERLNTGRASGGGRYCPDVGRACKTVSGTFKIYSKGGPGCASSKYPIPKGGAPMPYCMYFKGGYAIHGSNDVPNRNASHGCIRVTPKVAKWLSRKVMKIGTTVIILPYSARN